MMDLDFIIKNVLLDRGWGGGIKAFKIIFWGYGHLLDKGVYQNKGGISNE